MNEVIKVVQIRVRKHKAKNQIRLRIAGQAYTTLKYLKTLNKRFIFTFAPSMETKDIEHIEKVWNHKIQLGLRNDSNVWP